MDNNNAKNGEITLEWVMSKMETILNDNNHITDSLAKISQINPSNGPDCQAEAIASIITAREATNQQMLRLLEHIYNDLTPKAPNTVELMISSLASLASQMNSEDVAEIVKSIVDKS